MNLAYKVQLEKKALKQLRKLDAINQRNIATFIDTHLQGTHAPRKQGKALTGHLKGFWRYRVGDYRIICDIKDDELIILAITIAHRREVYK